MIQKVQEQYYEMGYALMGGMVVDEKLKSQIEAVLSQAKETIFRLIDENPNHVVVSRTSLVYPHGKQTSINYQQPPSEYDLGIDGCKQMLEPAFTMREVEHMFVSNERMDIDDIKAFAQRAIEDEQDKKQN